MWLLLFSVMSVRVIHVVVCVLVLFSVAEQHFTVRIHYNLFVQSPADRHLGCFQFGNILNESTVNILVHEFLWTYPFIVFLGTEYLGAEFLVI